MDPTITLQHLSAFLPDPNICITDPERGALKLVLYAFLTIIIPAFCSFFLPSTHDPLKRALITTLTFITSVAGNLLVWWMMYWTWLNHFEHPIGCGARFDRTGYVFWATVIHVVLFGGNVALWWGFWEFDSVDEEDEEDEKRNWISEDGRVDLKFVTRTFMDDDWMRKDIKRLKAEGFPVEKWVDQKWLEEDQKLPSEELHVDEKTPLVEEWKPSVPRPREVQMKMGVDDQGNLRLRMD